MIGGILLVLVGGVVLYAGFTDYWDAPWLVIADTIGGKSPKASGRPVKPKGVGGGSFRRA